ncbi:MAG: tetratricopeptide repeat protein [Phycisphaerae bacterium]|nr:tetratricopeptide repeat protein [Phycisphaerae bacterium]
MNRCLAGRSFALLSAVVGMGMLVVGCGPEYRVELRYDRPAQYEIPETIRSLGIAEFGGQDPEDVEWGNIASDRLASQLDAYNKQYQRYQLVDRKRLKAVLDEQDLQAAIVDSAKAVEAGKIAHVDAMIYGTMNVTTRDEEFTQTVVDPFSRSTKQVQRTKRYVMAAVNFTIDDVTTSKTLTTVSVVREYDSEKDKSGGRGGALGKLVGMGGDKLPASDQILSGLIDECVAVFVAKISPHQVVVSEKLGKGKSDSVQTGNKLAVAGDYAEALDLYKTAAEANSEDHEALFNAGVMCEALGRLGEAEQYYDRAFKLKPQEQYALARKRVRTETSATTEAAQ